MTVNVITAKKGYQSSLKDANSFVLTHIEIATGVIISLCYRPH
jgi:hypothetical protein